MVHFAVWRCSLGRRSILPGRGGSGVPDLSGHDYEKYWLCDVMHLGWKSWVEVDRAMVGFYGGAEAEGAGSEARGSSAGAFAEGAGDSPSAVFAGGSRGADETDAERLARKAEEEMLEVEGAGKEVFEEGRGANNEPDRPHPGMAQAPPQHRSCPVVLGGARLHRHPGMVPSPLRLRRASWVCVRTALIVRSAHDQIRCAQFISRRP